MKKSELKQLKEAAAYFGRIGGLKRKKNLTKERRTEIAREAGKLRWKNHKKELSSGK